MSRLAWTLALASLARVAAAQEGPDDTTFAGGKMVRGVVTAAAPDRLTLKTDTGDIYQVVTTSNTRVMKDRAAAKVTDVHAGDGVGAMGTLDPATRTVHAAFVVVMDAEQVRKAREALGKTMIVGKVTAIDDLKLTIMRADGVSQVIQVDEGTSFRRGRGRGRPAAGQGPGRPGPDENSRTDAQASRAGESITLADVKVGDTVAGPGVIKNGFFTPTQLAVSDPARQRRGPGTDAGPQSGAHTPPAIPDPAPGPR